MKSSNSYLRYVDLNFVPDRENYILTKYFVNKNPASKLEGLAFLGSIAAESSTGTWIEVVHDSNSSKSVSGIVYKYDESNKTTCIAYPIALFEPGNISQMLTVVAGNAFGLSDLSSIKLIDIYFPKQYRDHFKGPRFGADGIYQLLNADATLPIIGTIMKPKCGLDAKTYANITFQAWAGEFSTTKIDGVDMIKDDEALTSQSSFQSQFDERVKLVFEQLKRAEDLTGKKKAYVPNITHSKASESIRRAELVLKLGGNFAMIDYVISGAMLLDTLRDQNYDLAIHGHRTLFAALHRSQDFGIDYKIWAKIFRMIGGDQVHTGTPALGVMSGNADYVKDICRIVRDRGHNGSEFEIDWLDTAGCLPICGAGLDPLTLKPLVDSLGNKVAMFAGGGTHGHPNGTAAGASSLRAAVNALKNQISFSEFADKSKIESIQIANQFFAKFDKQNPNDTSRAHM